MRGNPHEQKNKQNFIIQRTVAIIIGVVGLSICVVNFTHNLSTHTMTTAESFFRAPVLGVLAPVAVIFITGFIDSTFSRILQVFIGYSVGGIAILDAYDSIFGLGLFIIFTIIAFKYGMFKRYARIKLAGGIGAVYSLTIISANSRQTHTQIMLGLDSLLYITIFLVILYVIYSNEIKEYIARNQAAESTIAKLLGQREDLEKKLSDLNFEIESLMHDNETIDFDACGITERERDVLYALVVYKDTGREIAERLEIGHETVKTHLKHIRDKLGVDRRDEIIELCRNNFIKEGNNI